MAPGECRSPEPVRTGRESRPTGRQAGRRWAEATSDRGTGTGTGTDCEPKASAGAGRPPAPGARARRALGQATEAVTGVAAGPSRPRRWPDPARPYRRGAGRISSSHREDPAT
jgi:hypothetical protein